MFSSPLVHNSMIMAVLLILAIGLIWLIIRKIAGKGIISKLSGMTLLAVAIDCELAFILGQINLSIFNILSIFTPGIIITLVIIYMMHKIVVVPVQNLIEIGKKLAIGDINNEVPYVSNDEIGDLAKVVRSVITYQKSISSSAKKIISGDISIIKPLSEKDELSNSFNVLVTTLANLIAEIKLLTKHAIEGELNTRGNITKFEGGFREIINGINYTLDAVITPVNEGSIVLEAMSKGDLTVSVKGIYKGDHQKLKTSINQLAESMNRALNEVNDAVEATASSANEISASSDQMAKSSSEQSQQTNEIVASIAQMTKTIVENSHNISKASENSLSASDSAKEGKEKVDATKKGIFEIVSSTKTTGSKISLLAARTDQIGEITQVINDIADQTNLLALNAAIEAARAGEQGRGFSVVADEVRKLAERTSKATKEIADTIKLIQAEAFDVQRSMEVATLAVEKGVNLTEEVASSLNHILLKNNEVSDIVVQIASSGEEQAAGAEEISRSIGVISNVSHQSLDGITQIAKAADDLNNLTINLQRLVSRFRLNRSNKNDYLVP